MRIFTSIKIFHGESHIKNIFEKSIEHKIFSQMGTMVEPG